MADNQIRTAGDYDKVIYDLGKKQIGLTNEIAAMKQKRTAYAAAAKHLQICRTYKSVWMEYVAKPLNQKQSISISIAWNFKHTEPLRQNWKRRASTSLLKLIKCIKLYN